MIAQVTQAPKPGNRHSVVPLQIRHIDIEGTNWVGLVTDLTIIRDQLDLEFGLAFWYDT